MKKVTVFVGSAHKRLTYQAARQFIEKLQALGEVECELVTLSDYKLGLCRGCRLCFEKGEEFCPLKDDRDVLFEKIMASDGVVFATPNYLFQMSGIMKTFLDRFGFIGHRPRFFGKAFACIVTQGFGGGKEIVKYFDFSGKVLGFNNVKGAVITGLDPRSEKEQKGIDKALAALSRRYYATLSKPAYPVPSLFMLMGFRMGRGSVRKELDEKSYDFRYYRDKGWLTSDYFYPIKLPLFKRAAGMLFDRMLPVIRTLMA